MSTKILIPRKCFIVFFLLVADGSQSLITGIGIGHFRFTGGTGRFANATGIVSYVVEQNFLTGGYTITAVGSIDY